MKKNLILCDTCQKDLAGKNRIDLDLRKLRDNCDHYSIIRNNSFEFCSFKCARENPIFMEDD